MEIIEITDLNPSAFIKVRVDWITNKFKDGRKAVELRMLERKLANIITICNGHRTKNVARYASPYASLYEKAETLVAEFCTQYGVDQDDVYAQMPAMAELKSWAVRPPDTGRVGRLLVYLLGPVIGLVIIGLASGYAQRLIHFGWHLAHLGS